MFKVFKVKGQSLYPHLEDGDRVLCKKIYKDSSLYIGDTVLFNKEPYGLMIKKITFINLGQYELKGTNPDSIDSRNFGMIDRPNIHYKFLFKF